MLNGNGSLDATLTNGHWELPAVPPHATKVARRPVGGLAVEPVRIDYTRLNEQVRKLTANG